MSRFQVSLLLLSTLLFSGIRSIPPLCSPAEPWSVNGRDLVGQYKGRLLLLAFMPMRCESCALEFKKLNAIGMKLREIKVVVVAPQHETPEDVRRAAEDYRYVEIVQETAREPLWRWLDVTANDRLIFDRCGRLAKVIRAKKAESDTYHDILNSLKSALNYAHCGWCQYDNDATTAAPHVPTSVTAYLITSTHRNDYAQQQQPLESKPLSQPRDTRRYATEYQPASANTAYQQRQQYHQEALRQARPDPRYQAQRYPPQNPPQPRQDPYGRQPDYRIYNNPEFYGRGYVTAAPTSAQVQPPPPGQAYRGEYVNERGETVMNYPNQQTNYGSTYEPRRPQQQANVEQSQKIFGQTNQIRSQKDKTTEHSAFYNDGEVAPDDEQDYLDYIADWTTPMPTVPPQQDQIPPTRPPFDPSLWPTPNPRFIPSMPNYPKAQLCAAYTDDICFKQQEQLKPNEIHECCQSRLLLSDICIPGKCSNTTVQLCCIQKFLQAKMTCCDDNTMSEPGLTGFEFSKCCYTNFVDEKDECCPHKYADLQWRFVHELCLPHVEFDLSNVKVPTQIPGTTVTAHFDFSKSDKWKFQCRNGQNAKHYSYYPEDDGDEVQLDEN
ncbi:hypothetical protein QR680_012095 [Steinernema hermaphroditum]|uniref:Selenoprotein P N-terminal domain-containing protein n=1 Tax=Steinernema hermaphroditum TaxID=289476 RepID=A0AA39LZY4_9BILA|nr:hypothetical protein QR680_012095 [Steinernema hermaphroditum]